MLPVNVPDPLRLVLAETVRKAEAPGTMLLALVVTPSQLFALDGVAVRVPPAALVTVTNCS
jgi:hypothetical protein